MQQRDARGSQEELQGLTDTGPSDAVLRELGWLKEPEEREVSDDEDASKGQLPVVGGHGGGGGASLRATADDRGDSRRDVSVDPSAIALGRGRGSPTAGQRAQNRGAHWKATMMGNSDGDSEMQSLKIDTDGSSARQNDRPKRRLYDVWPSRNKFFCRGLFMTGGETELGITPNCSVPNLCVWTCILAPCTLYLVWVFPHLWSQHCYAMPMATVAVFFMASGFLLATCCSDPGIIPRREVIQATNTAAKLEAALGYDVLASSCVSADGRDGGRYLPVELTSRGYRWCRTCRIVRPPRASHCPDCDNCVLRYDHHCPFVNNCVGQRNYHFFFGFVTCVLLLALLVLPVLFWFLNSDNFEVDVDAMMHVNSGVLKPVFYALIAVGCMIGIAASLSFLLWLYHCFLIATRRTTKEFRKNISNVTEEPTLCASRGSRLFDPRALVDPRALIRPDEAPPSPGGYLCHLC
jgi:hypothetical protein